MGSIKRLLIDMEVEEDGRQRFKPAIDSRNGPYETSGTEFVSLLYTFAFLIIPQRHTCTRGPVMAWSVVRMLHLRHWRCGTLPRL